MRTNMTRAKGAGCKSLFLACLFFGVSLPLASQTLTIRVVEHITSDTDTAIAWHLETDQPTSEIVATAVFEDSFGYQINTGEIRSVNWEPRYAYLPFDFIGDYRRLLSFEVLSARWYNVTFEQIEVDIVWESPEPTTQ